MEKEKAVEDILDQAIVWVSESWSTPRSRVNAFRYSIMNEPKGYNQLSDYQMIQYILSFIQIENIDTVSKVWRYMSHIIWFILYEWYNEIIQKDIEEIIRCVFDESEESKMKIDSVRDRLALKIFKNCKK